MSCQRTPPASPRAPKIQQQSWDDCNSPPINLYDPKQHQIFQPPQNQYRDSPPRSPTIRSLPQQPQLAQPPKSPKTPRKFNKPINVNNYYDASNSTRSPSSSISSRTNYNSSTSIGSVGGSSSPKYENPPCSPKITTTYANDDETLENSLCHDDSSSTASYYQTPTSGSRSPKQPYNYYNENRNQSPRRSPKSPRKFVFDAISPNYEQQGQNFEYYDATPNDDSNDTNVEVHSSPSTKIPNMPIGRDSIPTITGGNQTGSGLIRRNSKNYKSRTISTASGNDPVSLNRINNGNTTQNYNRKDSLSNRYHQQQQQQQQQPQFHLLDEFPSGNRNMYLKRDSCMTESTQLSGDSCETNGTATTTLSSEISKCTKPNVLLLMKKNSGSGGSNNGRCNDIGAITSTTNTNNGRSDLNSFSTNSNITENTTGSGGKKVISRDCRGRRHAINITSNPGYQVLHSSHSTLDRTCSDSVVSLRCRKSTSDLTNMDTADESQPITKTKPRRRGSSKGGLAYLASRRSSRESMKSACSNASIFSNEDIGPLAFQASQRGRQRRTSNFLELPVPDHIRPRVCSLPDRPYNPRVSDDLYRLRHFSISKGTVVNCGDSIISRRSRSNTSVNSTTSRASERSPFEGSCCGGGYANVDSMPPSPTTDSDEPPPPPRYRIVMLGDASVGKTALVSQFMTSEYMHTYDASLDDEFGEKTVSILLDDEESELVFIDHPSIEMSVENSLSTYEPHGCVVIYSVVDRNSFRVAEDIINYLWRENITKDKAVILVGNKADLARSRMITCAEGKTLAASRDVKFIETSSGIQHNVDELLVGTLKQMRLKEKREKKQVSKMKSSRTHISLHLAKELLQKICLTDIAKSKSCENLHVL